MPEVLTMAQAYGHAMQWMVYGWVMVLPISIVFRVLT